MKDASQIHPPEEDALERLVQQCADNPLAPRVLLRLYGAAHGRALGELADSLRVHPSDVRKTLRAFLLAGLVMERGTGRHATYSLSTGPADRRLVTELLHRAIDSGGSWSVAPAGSGAEHA